jgi:hypothetical protein
MSELPLSLVKIHPHQCPLKEIAECILIVTNKSIVVDNEVVTQQTEDMMMRVVGRSSNKIYEVTRTLLPVCFLNFI